MLMPNRYGNDGEKHRYGFQNQEKDDEVYNSEGTYINYKYRGVDTRIGRFFAEDPLYKDFPWNSPYAFSENRVIASVELEGLEAWDLNKVITDVDSYEPGGGNGSVTTTWTTDVSYRTYGPFKDKESAMATAESGGSTVDIINVTNSEHVYSTYRPWASGVITSTTVVGEVIDIGIRQPVEYGLQKTGMSDEAAYTTSSIITFGATAWLGGRLKSGGGSKSTNSATTWNSFQTMTKGQFASRAEAGVAWTAYKAANSITTGVARSQSQKSSFLKLAAASGLYPKYMNQWMRKGKVPPGYHVDHIKPLSIGGKDIPSNMRLLDQDFHMKIHHKFYRPWE
jgi:hypothetical protein